MKAYEYIHARGIVHRDVKPDNFVLTEYDNQECEDITLIDFGLASSIYANGTEDLKEMKEGRRFVGTPAFGSLNVHKGLTYSRRDDLESLAYVAIELVTGTLPWRKIKEKDIKLKVELIGKMKEEMKVSKICKGCPIELQKLLKYARMLKYEDAPKFSKLISLFE